MQSGRQESNLPMLAYQTSALPLGFGPKGGSRSGRNRTLLACFGGTLLPQKHGSIVNRMRMPAS